MHIFFYGADWHDPIHSKDFFAIHQIDKMKYFDEITQKFISNSDLCKYIFIFSFNFRFIIVYMVPYMI